MITVVRPVLVLVFIQCILDSYWIMFNSSKFTFYGDFVCLVTKLFEYWRPQACMEAQVGSLLENETSLEEAEGQQKKC